jgi:hypothetical protein
MVSGCSGLANRVRFQLPDCSDKHGDGCWGRLCVFPNWIQLRQCGGFGPLVLHSSLSSMAYPALVRGDMDPGPRRIRGTRSPVALPLGGCQQRCCPCSRRRGFIRLPRLARMAIDPVWRCGAWDCVDGPRTARERWTWKARAGPPLKGSVEVGLSELASLAMDSPHRAGSVRRGTLQPALRLQRWRQYK